MAEVDSATIYIAILKELYGRLNPPDGFSATESEFLRARDRGKRLSVVVAADAPGREGHLSRFVDRVRFWITTENYASTDDLERRVVRRLHEFAGEALSPWVKLGDLVFRADLIDDRGDEVTIRARVSEEIAHQLETARDQRFGTSRLRAVYRGRVVDAELTGVRHTTAASGTDELTIELARVQRVQSGMPRAGTGGRSPDDLVELRMRLLFLGEPLPDSLGMLGNMTDPGIDHNDLRQAFHQPNETAQAITRLVITEGLVGAGNAGRLTELRPGPRAGTTRRVYLEWLDPQGSTNTAPNRRRIEGDWHLPPTPA